jgi:hypothetical protein
LRSTRSCDFLTFYGDQEDYAGFNDKNFPKVNPTLPNTWNVNGALVAWLDPRTRTVDPGYVDTRGEILPSGAARENKQAKVFIDGNAALAAAAAGLANLPAEFFAQSCPSFESIATWLEGGGGSIK